MRWRAFSRATCARCTRRRAQFARRFAGQDCDFVSKCDRPQSYIWSRHPTHPRYAHCLILLVALATSIRRLTSKRRPRDHHVVSISCNGGATAIPRAPFPCRTFARCRANSPRGSRSPDLGSTRISTALRGSTVTSTCRPSDRRMAIIQCAFPHNENSLRRLFPPAPTTRNQRAPGQDLNRRSHSRRTRISRQRLAAWIASSPAAHLLKQPFLRGEKESAQFVSRLAAFDQGPLDAQAGRRPNQVESGRLSV